MASAGTLHSRSMPCSTLIQRLLPGPRHHYDTIDTVNGEFHDKLPAASSPFVINHDERKSHPHTAAEFRIFQNLDLGDFQPARCQSRRITS